MLLSQEVAFRMLIKHHYGNQRPGSLLLGTEDVPLEDAVSTPTAPSEAPGHDLLLVFSSFIIH